MSRGKKPDRIRILNLLDGREGFSTRQIKRALNLSDDRYNVVRDELLRDGVTFSIATSWNCGRAPTVDFLDRHIHSNLRVSSSEFENITLW
jgi:hypothetical protein